MQVQGWLDITAAELASATGEGGKAGKAGKAGGGRGAFASQGDSDLELQIEKGRAAMEAHLLDLARSGGAAAEVHRKVVRALQAVQRETCQEVNRLKAAAGGASEAEKTATVAAIAAKEASARLVVELQVEA